MKGLNAVHIHCSVKITFPNDTHSHSTQHRQSIAWQSETRAEMEVISHFLLARLYLQCKINLILIWRWWRWGSETRWRAATNARVQIRCVAQLYFLVSPVLERKPPCSATLFSSRNKWHRNTPSAAALHVRVNADWYFLSVWQKWLSFWCKGGACAAAWRRGCEIV